MYCALEFNGFRQLKKTEPELCEKALKTSCTALELRGGRRVFEDGGYFIFSFPSHAARHVFEAACDVEEGLAGLADKLMGFLLLLEFFQKEPRKEAARDFLRSLTAVREIDDSFLLGPGGANFFKAFCSMEKSGSCFRVVHSRRKGASGPGPKEARDFCLRKKVVEEIVSRLGKYIDCEKPPRAFFVRGSAFAGAPYQVDAALKKLLGGSPVCEVYPLPGRELPALEFSGFGDIPSVLSQTEKSLWEILKNVFLRARPLEFPFAEALGAYSLALTAYIRQCENAGSPAILLCSEFQAMPELAKRILALLFSRNLPDWRLVPVCVFRGNTLHDALGEEFKKIPRVEYEIPPLEEDEISSIIPPPSLALFQAEPKGGSMNISGGRGFPRSREIHALYFALFSGEAQETGKSSAASGEFQPLINFLRKEDRELREILWIIQEAAGLLSRPMMEEFLAGLDITLGQCGDIIRQLADMGLIRSEKNLVPLFPELRRFLRKDESLRKEKITEALSAFLYAAWKDGKIAGEYILLDFFAESRKGPWLTEVFHACITELLDTGNIQEAQRFLREKFTVFHTNDMMSIQSFAALRLALLTEECTGSSEEEDNKKGETSTEIFSRLEPAPKDSPCYADGLIQKALYWLRQADCKEALDCAKNAVMSFQGQKRQDGLSRAYTAVGLAMLAADAPEEALDYFLMARESGSGSMKSIFFEGVCRFITGNLSRALDNFTRAAELAADSAARRWTLAARFLEGRIFFELGEYAEACRAFELLLCEAESLQYSQPAHVLYAWLARSFIYKGEFRAAGRILEKESAYSLEAMFFHAEADYFKKNYKKAETRLESLLGIPYRADAFRGDGFMWSDGFYFAENLAIGRKAGVFFLPNQLRFFHTYLCGERETSSSAIAMMGRLIRDERNSKNDPSLRLYYYWYSKILPEEQSPAYEARFTVLGRAMQNLQARTSKMDNPAHKRAFTEKNYWNRLLKEDARRHNLA